MATQVQLCYETLAANMPSLNNNYIIPEIHDKTKDLSYSCSLCKITATSHKVLQRHYDGRKHKLRMERDGKTFFCDLCEITANSQKQLDNHLKVHAIDLIQNKGIYN